MSSVSAFAANVDCRLREFSENAGLAGAAELDAGDGSEGCVDVADALSDEWSSARILTISAEIVDRARSRRSRRSSSSDGEDEELTLRTIALAAWYDKSLSTSFELRGIDARPGRREGALVRR
jgi:hypothetical protein